MTAEESIMKEICISSYIGMFCDALRRTFGERICFAGLQGSYGRGEATESSDIDLVVILDRLSPQDIAVYRHMLSGLPYRDRACGFLSGRRELENWEPSDLFQFYFDTEPLIGSLDFLRNLLSREAVERAVRIGACNLYHGCVHNMVHERDPEILSALYKSAVFLLQAVCFRGTGLYLKKRADLRKNVSGREREILDIAEERKREKSLPEMNGAAEAAERAEMMAEMAETAESGSEKRKEQFERQSELLFLWAQQLLLDFSGRKASENS